MKETKDMKNIVILTFCIIIIIFLYKNKNKNIEHFQATTQVSRTLPASIRSENKLLTFLDGVEDIGLGNDSTTNYWRGRFSDKMNVVSNTNTQDIYYKNLTPTQLNQEYAINQKINYNKVSNRIYIKSSIDRSLGTNVTSSSTGTSSEQDQYLHYSNNQVNVSSNQKSWIIIRYPKINNQEKIQIRTDNNNFIGINRNGKDILLIEDGFDPSTYWYLTTNNSLSKLESVLYRDKYLKKDLKIGNDGNNLWEIIYINEINLEDGINNQLLNKPEDLLFKYVRDSLSFVDKVMEVDFMTKIQSFYPENISDAYINRIRDERDMEVDKTSTNNAEYTTFINNIQGQIQNLNDQIETNESIMNKKNSDISKYKEDIHLIENNIETEKEKNLYVEKNQSRNYIIPFTKDVYSFYIYIGITVVSILLCLYFVISIFF